MSRRRLAGLAVVLVLVMLFGGRWLAVRYTEHLWFEELGQASRHWLLTWRALAWQAGTLAALFLWYGAHTYGVYRSIGSVQLPRRLGNLEISEAVPRRTLRSIALAFAALLALATTWAFADLDTYVALYRHTVPLGLTDPVLGRDAAFYLARLPLLEVTHLLATIAVLLAAFIVVSLYALTGSLSISRRRVRITPHARTHMVVLLGSLALIIAWGFQLDALQLVGGGGTQNGVLSVVDRSVRIPASNALAMVALFVAAGSMLSLRWARPLILFILWATLAAAALLGRFLVPAMSDAWGGDGRPELAQQLAVHGDGHTREAFGLIQARRASVAGGDWNGDSAAHAAQTLAGLSPWSGEPGLLERTLSRVVGDTSGALRWTTAHVVTGSRTLAVLGVAQVDLVALARLPQRPSWEDLHRRTLAWGEQPLALDARLRRGLPPLLASLADGDDTLRAGESLRREPRPVRFLAQPAELAVVGPDAGRVDQRPPGVLLRGVLRRLLLAWALQSPPLMDSHTSPADRVLYWRDMPTRLARLYPFASFDPARPALVDSRLLWVADGYIISQRYPLSQRLRWNAEDINYIAAPYIATVDAETGETRLYLRAPSLGFARGVARAEGVSPLEADSLPAEMARQLIYPAGLLGAQAAMLGRVLVGEGDRPWALATMDTTLRDPGTVRPALALLERDDRGARIWSIQGLAESAGARLSGIAAGAVADDGSLELEFSRVEGTSPLPSPQAAAARMAGAPVVVAASVAAGGPGALHHGPVTPLPSAGSVLYSRVLFGGPVGPNAREPALPAGVAVYAGGRVGFGADAPSAVRALSSADGGATLVLGGGVNMADARAAFLALDSARAAGDWERFGRAWTALRRALNIDGATPLPRPVPRP